jgi:uncharacterized protein
LLNSDQYQLKSEHHSKSLSKLEHMSQLFAVVVATVPEYYDYKNAHPEHDQNQLAWFREQQEKGTLLCCGPFFPHDGTGLWVIQAENLEAAQAIVNSSPRVRDGMLADSARVVEWQVHIGHELFEQAISTTVLSE